MSYAVIPSIRVANVAEALAFYIEALGFELVRGGPDEANNSLRLGEAHIMIESPGTFYSNEYNAAIRERMGSASPMSLYIEAPDLAALHASALSAGVRIIDPIADRAWGQKEFTVEDPAGNWLTFWQATAATA